MKKLFKLFTIPALTMAGLIPTTILSTSCSNTDSLTEDVVKEFKEFSEIPHSSDQFLRETPYGYGKVWDLSCHIKNRIETILGKKIFQDKYGNLVFDIPCNDDSLKDAPKIALQAHMDMVFSYNPNELPFEPDPRIWKVGLVDETIDGKRIIHSDKWRTTIGADNGIGVAQILTILQHNEIKHPDLRCILTNCEENGLQGATLLVEDTYPDVLKDYYYVLNIDGEDLGDLCIGCSGAVGSYYYINTDREKSEHKYEPIAGENFFKIKIDGFPGGHSGVDITKRYDNALVFTTAVLDNISTVQGYPLELNAMSTPGTTAYNAIPKTCEAVVCSQTLSTATIDEIKTIVDKAVKQVIEDRIAIEKPEKDKRTQYTTKFDPDQYKNITCTVEKAKPKYEVALSELDTKKILTFQNGQNGLEYGIIAWPTDEEVAALTGEQSSANIGPVEAEMVSSLTFEYKLSTYSRSTEKEQIELFYQINEGEARDVGATYKYDAKYNPWKVDENKKLLNLCKDGWIKSGVAEEKVIPSRTHGGLETSLWHQAMEVDESKIGKTACISYGPQIYDAHKYTERVEVDTIKNCLDTTIYILAHANELKIE